MEVFDDDDDLEFVPLSVWECGRLWLIVDDDGEIWEWIIVEGDMGSVVVDDVELKRFPSSRSNRSSSS